MSAAVDHDAELRGSEQIIRDELSIWPVELRRVLLASLLAECDAAKAPPLRPLTGRQRAVLDFICRYIDRFGTAPSWREIGAATGIRSTNGVSDHLRLIERKGYIELHGGTGVSDGPKRRAIRVLRRPTP